MENTPPRSSFSLLIILIAIALVYGLQHVPWSKISGDRLTDYDLLSDLRTAQADVMPQICDTVMQAPLAPMAQLASNKEETAGDTIVLKTSLSIDSLQAGAETTSTSYFSDDSTQAVKTIREAVNPRINGEMAIEDYTEAQSGLSHLRAALADPSRPARIAVIGDSYIEGDIFTQDIRNQLQRSYGGHGVGYMPAASQVQGFRRSVVHSNSGATHHGLPNGTPRKYFTLAGEYHTLDAGATVTYKGHSRDSLLASWDRSTILFIAPSSGSITLITDNDTLKADISSGTQVQSLKLDGHTKSLRIRNKVPGLVFLGAWLEDANGVSVDCMSLRGYAGLAHKSLDQVLAADMRRYIDYDLIIIEYGMNALSLQQKDYSIFGKNLQQTIEQVRSAYPNSDILVLGCGDRGHKSGGEVRSMPTLVNMIDNQRLAARNSQVLFWDTREAMGGIDAVADWRQRKLINGDYIHLNSAGGKALATELVKSLKSKLNE